MISLDKTQTKELSKSRMTALAILVLVPAVFFVVALLLTPTWQSVGSEVDFAFYILIIVAALSPLMLPLIERTQLRNFRKQSNSTMSASQLFTITTITKLAFVECGYIMGLVIFLLSGDYWRMLIFYVVGIYWSFVYWPREENFRRFIKRSEEI